MKKGYAVNPTFAYNLYSLGLAYVTLGDDAKAEQWFMHALKLQPDLHYALVGLTEMNLAKGNNQAAVEHSQKALSLVPNDLAAFEAAGDAELFLGNYEQAKFYFEKALLNSAAGSREYRSRRPATCLGYIYWKSGQKEKAQTMFRQSLAVDQKELDQGSEFFAAPYDLAAINAIQGNKAEAYKWLQKTIDEGWLLYRIAERDPLLENLRSDDRFKQMMANVKSMVEEQRRRVEEMEKQ